MKKAILIIIAALLTLPAMALAQGDAELELITSSAEMVLDEEFTVDIILKNPSAQAVISARSWINYDPVALEAVRIESSDSPFTLSAPGEDTISVGEGRVKIGRSNISGGVKEAEAKVASVVFKVKAQHEATTMISFYDYQVNELGHTSVNVIEQGFPANILASEPESIELSLNPGVAPPAPELTPTPIPTPTPTPIPTPTPTPAPTTSQLIRPVQLMVNTGVGYVDLKWTVEQDLSRVGFNIYYGKTSGQYTRRRTISNFDNYRLDGLTTGEVYYFAVTAYDSSNRESDYSNEVGVIVGQPLSSTAPFASLFQQTVSKIPSHPQNGPLVGWLAFTAVGLGGALVFGPKRKYNC